MSEAKPSKPKATNHTAIKKLYTEIDGLVKKGDQCTCSEKEAALFKSVKAI